MEVDYPVFVPAYQRNMNPELPMIQSQPVLPVPVIIQQIDIPQPTVADNPFGPINDEEMIIGHVIKFLYKNDLMICRKVSKSWNHIVQNYLNFQIGLCGKISKKWYKQVSGKGFNFDMESTLKWKSFELYHFSYHHNSAIFKNFWHNSCSNLNVLTLHGSSFECDAFEFLLDHCPVLETLNIQNCKLRDLSDIHSNNIKRPRIGAECQSPQPISHGLRHLNVESVYKFEQCFMDYLIMRTENLESFTLTKCFFPSDNYLDPKISPNELLQMSNEFGKNMMILFAQNYNTMKKYGFHENNFQSEFFTNLKLGYPVNVSELSLTLSKPEKNSYEQIIQFINNCFGLQKLSLTFLGSVENNTLQNMLKGQETTLKMFKLNIYGNLIPQDKLLNLDYINTFLQLEEICIQDSKKLIPKTIKMVIGGKRSSDGLRKLYRNQEKILLTVPTHISPTFLINLPPNMKKLTLDKYICLGNLILPLDSNINFSKLTKLEIFGPWMYSMDNFVLIISQELKELETLALTSCGLMNKHLTGISNKSMYKLRYCLKNFPLDSLPTEQKLFTIIEASMPGYVEINATLPRLSDLKKLKYLDLSLNPNISNESVFDALRMPGLKTLALNGCTKINDISLVLMSLFLPELEELSVKYCQKMSKFGLSQLLNGCRKIKKLYARKMIKNKHLNGIQYIINPNYNDIVVHE